MNFEANRRAPRYVSRRRLLAAVPALALVVAGVSCSDDDDPEASASPAASASAAAATSTASAAPRTVETLYGVVTIPASVKRVLSLDFPITCAMIDLGVPLIGKTNYLPNFPAYTAAVKDLDSVETADYDLDIEKIAALKPDLILADDWADTALRQLPMDDLRKIAPIAVFEWQRAGGNWRKEAELTAAALGKSPEMAALVKKYTDRAAAIKTANAALLATKKWDIIDASEKVWDLYGPSSSHGRVVTDTGVTLAAGAMQSEGYVAYSYEKMDLLMSSDVIFTTTASMPFLNATPTFATLPAVKAGRVYSTDLFFPASYGIASALLENVEASIKKAG